MRVRLRPRSHPLGATLYGPAPHACHVSEYLSPALLHVGLSGARANIARKRASVSRRRMDTTYLPSTTTPRRWSALLSVNSAKPSMVSNRLAVGLGVLG